MAGKEWRQFFSQLVRLRLKLEPKKYINFEIRKLNKQKYLHHKYIPQRDCEHNFLTFLYYTFSDDDSFFMIQFFQIAKF